MIRTLLRGLIFVGLASLLIAARCRGDDDDATPSPSEADGGATPTAGASAGASPSVSAGASATASPTETATPGAAIGPLTVEQEVSVGGETREYWLYVPSTVYEGSPAALVIGMHGGFGNAEQFARTSEFDDEAERGGFIVVYPQGLGAVPTWNGGACCGYAAREDVDDVAFIDALIDEVAASYPVDPNRVFAVGHSNGAIMALRLACELSERIAAVGSVAGSLEIDSCLPERPVSVLMIHGDADLNHPLEGGMGPQSVANVEFNSVAATMETMRVADGCSEGTQVTRDIDIIVTIWACPPGVTVEQQIIVGGPHAWPGSDQVLLSGPASQAMDATAVLWEWLRDRGR